MIPWYVVAAPLTLLFILFLIFMLIQTDEEAGVLVGVALVLFLLVMALIGLLTTHKALDEKNGWSAPKPPPLLERPPDANRSNE